MKISGLAWAGVGVLVGVVIAGMALAPGMAAINEGLSCLVENCEDLAAQRSMAVAAWAMVVLTVVSAVVGAASLTLIYYTLLAAQRSALAAEDTNRQALASLDIAEQSLSVTRRMSVAQTRCYVTVSSVSAQFAENLDLTITLKNSGPTPARNLNVNLDIRMEFSGYGPVLPKVVNLAAPKIFLADLAGADKDKLVVRTGTQLTTDEEQALSNNRLGVRISGLISYVDIFGDGHPYAFGFEAKPEDVSPFEPFRLARMPVPNDESDISWV